MILPNQEMMKMTNTITTTEFAAELETDTRTARKFLRSITPKDQQPGKGARWEIAGTKTNLNKMRKQFNEWHATQAQEKANRAAEAAEKAASNSAEADEIDLDD